MKTRKRKTPKITQKSKIMLDFASNPLFEKKISLGVFDNDFFLEKLFKSYFGVAGARPGESRETGETTLNWMLSGNIVLSITYFFTQLWLQRNRLGFNNDDQFDLRALFFSLSHSLPVFFSSYLLILYIYLPSYFSFFFFFFPRLRLFLWSK